MPSGNEPISVTTKIQAESPKPSTKALIITPSSIIFLLYALGFSAAERNKGRKGKPSAHIS